MTHDSTRAVGFAPVVDANTRVLVLGSLPGQASLAAGQYYAHPRNAFWPIMDVLCAQPLSTLPYEQRLSVIGAHGVGLWDVLASAERSGSLDAAIRSPEAADLLGLIQSLPNLRAVAFNGATAAKIGRRIMAASDTAPHLFDLPSSSPAHARPVPEKAAHWMVLAPYLIART